MNEEYYKIGDSMMRALNMNSLGSRDIFKAITIASGGLSGGISSTIAGGSFWAGARQGLITSGLNHVAHSTIQRIKYNSFLSKVDEWISNQFLLISSEVVKKHNKISNLSK
ncbi:MAG: hypothetical protein WBF63_09170 [Moheibacter sp.]